MSFGLQAKSLRTTLLLGLLLSACQPPGQNADGSATFLPAERELIFSLTPLGEPPPNPSNRYADKADAARLGQLLFYDARLSGKGNLSCASCHNPALGWSDGRPKAVGISTGTRNSPTLWNVSHQRWLFWDGRADSLWAQSIQPLESPLEMGATRTGLYQTFQREADLKQAYQKVFGPLPVSRSSIKQSTDWKSLPEADKIAVNRFVSHLGKAFEAFERKLVSGESDFDRFARGLRDNDPKLQKAMSVDAQLGLRLFIGRAQCVLCHSGPNFSDGEFHNLGLPAIPGAPADEGRHAGIQAVLADPLNSLGRFSDADPDDAWADKLRYLSQHNSNRGEFRTPTLRELEHSGPYMHDGRFSSLEQVIAFYNTPEAHIPALGRREDTLQPLRLSAEEIKQLSAFLKALSSGPPAATLTKPPA